MSGVGCVGIVGIGRGARRFEGGVRLGLKWEPEVMAVRAVYS